MKPKNQEETRYAPDYYRILVRPFAFLLDPQIGLSLYPDEYPPLWTTIFISLKLISYLIALGLIPP